MALQIPFCRVVRVTGNSMMPALVNRSIVLVLSPYRHYREGEIVVFQTPGQESSISVKRIAKIIRDDRPGKSGSFWLELLGDNRSESLDSRIWGPVQNSALIGRVILSLWPLYRLSLEPFSSDKI